MSNKIFDDLKKLVLFLQNSSSTGWVITVFFDNFRGTVILYRTGLVTNFVVNGDSSVLQSCMSKQQWNKLLKYHCHSIVFLKVMSSFKAIEIWIEKLFVVYLSFKRIRSFTWHMMASGKGTLTQKLGFPKNHFIKNISQHNINPWFLILDTM